ARGDEGTAAAAGRLRHRDRRHRTRAGRYELAAPALGAGAIATASARGVRLVVRVLAASSSGCRARAEATTAPRRRADPARAAIGRPSAAPPGDRADRVPPPAHRFGWRRTDAARSGRALAPRRSLEGGPRSRPRRTAAVRCRTLRRRIRIAGLGRIERGR